MSSSTKSVRQARAEATEEDLVISALQPVIKALGRQLGTNVELVLHDLRTPAHSVVAITNGQVSGRRIGSPLIGGPRHDKGLQAVRDAIQEEDLSPYTEVADYTTLTKEGRTLRSSTVVLRNSAGKAYAAFCINIDTGVYRGLLDHLNAVLAGSSDESATDTVSPPGVDDLMKEIIVDAIDVIAKPVPAMRKDEKLRVVELMDDRGLFLVKGSVELAAQALGVTRFSVYNYLEEIRGRAKTHEWRSAARKNGKRRD